MPGLTASADGIIAGKRRLKLASCALSFVAGRKSNTNKRKGKVNRQIVAGIEFPCRREAFIMNKSFLVSGSFKGSGMRLQRQE